MGCTMQILILSFVTCCCWSLAAKVNLQQMMNLLGVEDQLNTRDGGVSSWNNHLLFKYMRAKYQTEQLKEMGSLVFRSFKWKDCGTANEVMKINGLDVTPDPLRLPGNISIKFDVDLSEDIKGPLKADVEIQKEIGPIWVTVPCIDDLGSCTYSDLCKMLNGTTCPGAFVKNNIPCKCPFQKGSYSMPTTSYPVTISKLPSGNYYAKIYLSVNQTLVNCVEIYADIESA